MSSHPPGAIVVGDAWLSRYLQGELGAPAPGATAPVLQVSKADAAVGGAALVAKTIAALGRRTQLISVCGNDGSGSELVADTTEVLDLWPRWCLSERPTQVHTHLTTTTNRLALILNTAVPVDEITRMQIVRTCLAGVTEAPVGAMVIADYGEQLLNSQAAIALMQQVVVPNNLPVFVTAPAHRMWPEAYMRATVIVMSRSEARKFVELYPQQMHPALWQEDKIEHTPALAQAIRKVMQASLVIVTCGEHGAYYADGTNAIGFPPLDAVEVCDPTGAPEAFLAAAVVSFLDGLEIMKAIMYCNEVAGIAVRTMQPKVVSLRDLDDRILDTDCPWRKVLDLPAAVAMAGRLRGREKRVAVVDGRFDYLHAGHMEVIKKAHDDADVVMVLMKEESQHETVHVRRERLSELARVHVVVVVPEAELSDAIRQIRPLYLFKGEECRTEFIPGADFVASHGGNVRFVPMLEPHEPTGDLHDSPQ